MSGFLRVIYAILNASVILERNETRLARNETRLARNETRLARNETRGGNLPLSGTVNASEATKRLRDRTENGKCTNVTNRRSHVGLSTPFYTENLCYRLEIFSNEFMNIIEEYKNHVTQCITTYCVVPENTHPKDSKVEGRLKNQLVCNGKYEVNLEFPER